MNYGWKCGAQRKIFDTGIRRDIALGSIAWGISRGIAWGIARELALGIIARSISQGIEWGIARDKKTTQITLGISRGIWWGIAKEINLAASWPLLETKYELWPTILFLEWPAHWSTLCVPCDFWVCRWPHARIVSKRRSVYCILPYVRPHGLAYLTSRTSST